MTTAALTVADLERALTAADPAALLIPPRVLRRVIKKDAGLTGPGLQVPHRKSYVIRRDALLQIADRDDLGLAPDRELPEILLLFPQPDPAKLRALPPQATLLKYWRLLFHAHVHQAVSRSLGDGPAAEAVIRRRIRLLGQTEADEVRSVLRQENFLLHSHNTRSIYEEFAAVFLELYCFAPHRLPAYFPAISDLAAVHRVLDAEVDAAGLFAATRLAGAPDPAPASLQAEGGDARTDWEKPPPPTPPDEAAHTRRMLAAAGAEKRGNLVRAALLREQAQRLAPPEQAPATRAGVAAVLERLAARLQGALAFPDSEAAAWRRALALLVGPASSGFWSREARLLYDLQRACIDQEREVFAVDLVEWFLSLGRRPVVRLLPHQRQVNLVRHLRAAAHRAASARLPEADRKQLLALLRAAIARNEEQLRDRFRPLLLGSLDESGLRPRSYAERVARDKIIEELLDRVADRGFLGIGDLRDALARNRLKLPDLSGPREFLFGDPLLRANRRLAVALDGVYRRGEIYLRWLQRFSSLAFGTPVGRFLTLYLVLPFGGAFLALEALQHVVHPIARLVDPPHAQPADVVAAAGLIGSPAAPGPLLAATSYHLGTTPHPVELVNAYSLPLLGLFLLCLFHVAWFRRRVSGALHLLWCVVRGVFYDLPVGVMKLPPVRAVFQSQAYLTLYQYVLKPLFWSALVALAASLYGAGFSLVVGSGTAAFLIAELLLHSRLGMRLEEMCGDALLRSWRLFSRDLIPGLIGAILGFFRRLLDDVERLLYTVDEWLRFRTGDSRGSVAVKAVLNLMWFFVTYVVRFCLNLLVEPQINPIKHFPVVTVSHKLVLTFFVPAAARALALTMDPALAATVAVVVGSGIPGVFGFLVWEFKENWRLYRANQPRELRPQTAGGHGETVARLLRPGFHSGTLPKLYARLRRVKAAGLGKRREELHHVKEALRRFVERNLLAVLAGSKTWATRAPLQVGVIHLASNRIRVELRWPGRAEQSVHLDLEERAGRLVAGVTTALEYAEKSGPGERRPRNGWLDHLPVEQVRAFTDALAGFYKACGVDLVREQVQALLPPESWFAVQGQGLVVETGPDLEKGAVYDLQLDGLLPPRPFDGLAPAHLRTLSADKLAFARNAIRWEDWVEAWERDLAGKGHKPPLLRGVRLLPPEIARGRLAARRRR